MTLDKSKKVLIVGLGLIGGSYADALSDKGFEVGAIARRRETLDYALKKGLIKSGETEVTEEYVKNFDIIVFCLYPKVFLEWLKNYGKFIKRGALVTDVTGVKCGVVYEAQRLLEGSGAEFIAAHPMAGKEVYGVENADKNIFKEANYIVTPTDKNTKEAIEACKDLGRILGFKRITELSPEEHDEMIGFTSQLTHCIAVSLMNCKDSPDLVGYTGNSFRDLTRIANINENMWTELFLCNRDELLGQMELFENKFDELKEALRRGDEETMKALMRESSKRRKLFDE